LGCLSIVVVSKAAFTWRKFPIKELLGDAALEVSLADALDVEDGLTEAG